MLLNREGEGAEDGTTGEGEVSGARRGWGDCFQWAIRAGLNLGPFGLAMQLSVVCEEAKRVRLAAVQSEQGAWVGTALGVAGGGEGK